MRAAFIILVVLSCLCAAVSPAVAQNGETYVLRPFYMESVRRAQAEDPGVNFISLRAQYAQMPFYDPLGTASADDLERHARAFLATPPGTAEALRALAAYKEFLAMHYGNLAAVRRALALCRRWPALGYLNALAWQEAGLRRSLLQAGNGRTLATAYAVFTLAEETELLAMLGAGGFDRSIYQAGGLYYAMHPADSSGRGTVFVNITAPIKALLAQEARERRRQLLSRPAPALAP